MKTLKKLRNINTSELARVMNVSPNMANKYKREPWKYDPPTSKALSVQKYFNIPVCFWQDIKSYIQENDSTIKSNTTRVQREDNGTIKASYE